MLALYLVHQGALKVYPDHLTGKEQGKSLVSVMEGERCLRSGGGAPDPGRSGRGGR